MKIIRWEHPAKSTIALHSPIRALRAHQGEWTGSPAETARRLRKNGL